MVNKLSVVVVCCGAFDYTEGCTKRLIRNTMNLDQLIIVDNGSPINIRGKYRILSREMGITLIELDKNYGPGKARCVGLEYVHNDIVGFVDDDIFVTKNWDIPLINLIVNNSNIAQVAPISAQVDHKNPNFSDLFSREIWITLQKKDRNFERIINVFQGGLDDDETFVEKYMKFNNIAKNYQLKCPPDAISGGCFITTQQSLAKGGGVADPNITTLGNEDIDLSWRLSFAGYDIYKCNNSYVHHFKHAGSNFLFNKTARATLFDQANIYFINKWKDTILFHLKLLQKKHGIFWENQQESWFIAMLKREHPEKFT